MYKTSLRKGFKKIIELLRSEMASQKCSVDNPDSVQQCAQAEVPGTANFIGRVPNHLNIEFTRSANAHLQTWIKVMLFTVP